MEVKPEDPRAVVASELRRQLRIQFWVGWRRVWSLLSLAGVILVGVTYFGLGIRTDKTPSNLAIAVLWAGIICGGIGVVAHQIADMRERRQAKRVLR